MKGSEIKFRDETCWLDGQRKCYEGLWLQLAAPIRLEIIVDTSVPRQSRAIAYVFSHDQMRWNQLASIPWPNMSSPDVIGRRAFGEQLDLKHFNADKVTLMMQARAILGSNDE